MDIDKAIQEMSLGENKPILLSNQAKFCSTERNACSIIGRFLNPPNQRMTNWILDMPRIWRFYSRVRGVALSQEKFQFIFKSEDDLKEVLNTGVWTQDDWCVVMERWIEKPPPDYLMFLPIWIRLRNIPVNYYTEETIKEIAKCVGEVLKVELELEKSQAQDYVRVRVLFDVRNPLRNSKEVQLSDGEIVSISFDYERVRKRCFNCQRLTHEKNLCPFKIVDSGKEVAEISKNDEKQKGPLVSEGHPMELRATTPKLLASAMKAPITKVNHSDFLSDSAFSGLSEDVGVDLFEGFSASLSSAGSSGLSIKQKSPRKRKAPLLKQNPGNSSASEGGEVSFNVQFDKVFKRKTHESDSESSKCLKRDSNTVVPREPPLDQ